jgi:hypothetical protein
MILAIDLEGGCIWCGDLVELSRAPGSILDED